MAIMKKTRIKYPIEYELKPMKIDKGVHWVTLSLKNIGKQELTALDIKLNSLDLYGLTVYGTGKYLTSLKPGKKELAPFQVSANRSTNLYLTVDGWKNGEAFSWESPYTKIKVGKEVAELASIFALTEPYPPVGRVIRVEATVRGLAESQGLSIEFWADSPSGDFKELATLKTKKLKASEEARYAAELTPSEKGLYTIHAYLYDGVRQIGHETDYVWVEKK